MTATDLNRANLHRLAPSIQVPSYDPASVEAGIVHLGLGGFHRAHMARYTHELMQRDPAAHGWGIVGAGLMPGDRRMAESLAPQDALYTLVERDRTKESVSIIGSLARVVFAGEFERRVVGSDRCADNPHCQSHRHGEWILPASGHEAA